MKDYKLISNEIAMKTLDISYNGGVGHIGSAISIVDLLTVLYFSYLNINKSNIKSPSRDRFILSKGHAAASLYATLFMKGLMKKNEISSFASDYDGLSEHPEKKDSGIEFSSGSLGHGLGYGVGVAYGQFMKNINAKTVVLISDGECGEGSIWEAALLASRLNLKNLTVVVDYNKWQGLGNSKEISNLEPFVDKWKSFGWHVSAVDGHDINKLINEFNKLPSEKNKPNIVIANTTTGKNISLLENNLLGHYKSLNENEYKKARLELMSK